MANVQTRRSISFALADFEAAQELAISMGIPLAQLAAQALREFLVRNRPLPPLPDLQPELDKRVGVLPRSHDPQMWPEISRVPVEAMNDGPDTLSSSRRIVSGPRAVEHADPFAVVDEVHTLRDIAHRMDKMAEADHPDAGEVRVVYDEET